MIVPIGNKIGDYNFSSWSGHTSLSSPFSVTMISGFGNIGQFGYTPADGLPGPIRQRSAL